MRKHVGGSQDSGRVTDDQLPAWVNLVGEGHRRQRAGSRCGLSPFSADLSRFVADEPIAKPRAARATVTLARLAFGPLDAGQVNLPCLV
jgi:hypothetical protein